MMLLDTDEVIRLIKEKKYVPGCISVVTLIEVLRGIETEKLAEIKHLLEESFPVLGLDNEVVRTYCGVYRRLRERGEQVPDADLLVAATAIAHGMTLMTGDRHFERLVDFGLSLEKPGASVKRVKKQRGELHG